MTPLPPPSKREPEVHRKSPLPIAVLIGVCCFVVYIANRRAISAADTYPARYLPFAILQHHTVFLNPVEKVVAQGRGANFWVFQRPDGRMVSLYPIVTPVLVSPLYVPAVAYLNRYGWTDARLDHVAKVMEKLAASLVAALSVSLLYLLLRRRTTLRVALLLTVAFAFGTTTWVISSQALWQHGVAQVLIVLALLLLTGPYSAMRAIGVGLLCGLIAGNRPPDAILAAALGVYALFWAGWRRAMLLAAAAALPLLLVIAYNLEVAGNPGGGYGLLGLVAFFSKPLLPGVAGLLFSPTRGLLVFSPFLLFLVVAWRHPALAREERILSIAMSVAVVVQVFLYAKMDWRAGLSWGPRYLTDLLPFLIWLLVPVVNRLRGLGRASFLAAVAVSIAIEAIGAFCYYGWVDEAIFATGEPRQMEGAWNWRSAPFLRSLDYGLASAEWGKPPRGSFDGLESAGRPTAAITAGQEIVATGWALGGRATPWQVAVVVDGQAVGVANTFSDRPDVRAAVKGAGPAGWRIPIDTSRLAEGEHTLIAFVWPVEWGESFYLQERQLTVRRAR